MPFWGLWVRLLGVKSIDPKNLESHMKKGTNICLLPGGFEEGSLTSYGQDKIYLNNRLNLRIYFKNI